MHQPDHSIDMFLLKISCPSRSSFFGFRASPQVADPSVFLAAPNSAHCPHLSLFVFFPPGFLIALVDLTCPHRSLPNFVMPFMLRLSTSQPNEQQTGGASPWCWELLCREAAASSPEGSVAFRMLRSLAGDDLALLAAYMVKQRRAVREDGVLKVIAGGGGGGGGGDRGAAIISETDRDLLRLRSSS